MVGLMLGVWFLSISIGSYIAGLATRLFEGNDTAVLTKAFGIFAGSYTGRGSNTCSTDSSHQEDDTESILIPKGIKTN